MCWLCDRSVVLFYRPVVIDVHCAVPLVWFSMELTIWYANLRCWKLIPPVWLGRPGWDLEIKGRVLVGGGTVTQKIQQPPPSPPTPKKKTGWSNHINVFQSQGQVKQNLTEDAYCLLSCRERSYSTLICFPLPSHCDFASRSWLSKWAWPYYTRSTLIPSLNVVA